MNISQVSLADLNQISSPATTSTSTTGTSFEDLFKSALSLANETAQASEQAGINLLTGDESDLHNIMIATEKADVALRLTLQIRNKILDAYNEMMRMQI